MNVHKGGKTAGVEGWFIMQVKYRCREIVSSWRSRVRILSRRLLYVLLRGKQTPTATVTFTGGSIKKPSSHSSTHLFLPLSSLLHTIYVHSTILQSSHSSAHLSVYTSLIPISYIIYTVCMHTLWPLPNADILIQNIYFTGRHGQGLSIILHRKQVRLSPFLS